MTYRPHFFPIPHGEKPSREAFNQLVGFYNELADEYEELFVERKIIEQSVRGMPAFLQAHVVQHGESFERMVDRRGYDVYKDAALRGEKDPMKETEI